MPVINFLPLVKAYPALSKTYGEVSCIAGVEYSPAEQLSPNLLNWIRLYPVPFRDLDDDQQFAKYQPITVSVERHSGDSRPETRRPDRDSIEVVGAQIPAKGTWEGRRRFVEPLFAESMCQIARLQASEGTSLGIFRPKKVKDVVIKEADIAAEKVAIAKASVAQGSLLKPEADEEKMHFLSALEQIPWSFKLKYECSDPNCNAHEQSIIDWEIAQYFRHIRNSANWEEELRRHILEDLCGPKRDAAVIVGNQHQYPNAFVVLGFWWPERVPQQLAL